MKALQLNEEKELKLVDQGIMPVFSGPGCPQQNGRHERMHRDLKAYCRNRIQSTLSLSLIHI